VDKNLHSPEPPPRYAWPKFAIAGVVLFLLLSCWWLLQEVSRIQRLKAANTIHPATNVVSPTPLPPSRP
jgi:hypothetical protein